MDKGTGLEKDYAKKDNELDEDMNIRKRIMQEKNENQEEETWATVVSRKKRNGAEMAKKGTEQQKIQGKEKDDVNGKKRQEESRKDEMINKLRGKTIYHRY
jgi:hypothetical protein